MLLRYNGWNRRRSATRIQEKYQEQRSGKRVVNANSNASPDIIESDSHSAILYHLSSTSDDYASANCATHFPAGPHRTVYLLDIAFFAC
jgi:hypothetical protein